MSSANAKPSLRARRMSKEQYEQVLPALRDALLTAQQRLQKDKSFALAIIITGVPTAGRSEVVNELLEWLDPKHVRVHALEDERRLSRWWPAMWRYWNALPARGTLSFYFMGWYEDYLLPAWHKRDNSRRDEERVFDRIRQLETMLPKDGVRVLKLHLNVSKKLQQQRIQKLSADKLTRWRVTREERWLVRHHDRVNRAFKRAIAQTDDVCPWHVIDGTDSRSRSFTTAQAVLQELERGLHASRPVRVKPPAHARSKVHHLRSQHGGESVEDDVYDKELEQLQGRFALLTRRRRFERHGAVFAFEGMDAAGKGGTIRRLTSALDARQYDVVPVSAPTAEERAYPYLWRFWRNVPRRGEIAIFDRSWYGRVLVERVRGFAAPEDWQRAYDEIREFELQMCEHGLIVHKFWLQVGQAEQLKRFEARDNDKLKRFKVDPEDWENRRFYDQYQLAAHEMIQRTDSEHAPWTLVEADDKKYARLKVLRTVCEAIERTLG
ncbi:MAG: polyphosphate:AMP phosphotransferase [Povalibacter sp.]